MIPNLNAATPRRVLIAVLPAFGDESHDEHKARVFAVASLCGTDAEWAEFQEAWNTRTEGRCFHAAACESDAGQYAKNTHRENLKLYADLARLIAKSSLLGFGAALNVDDYYSCFRYDQPDEVYYFGFAENVKYCREVATYSIPPEQVQFTFDRSFDREYNAGQLYDQLCRRPEWQPYLSGRLQFAPRDEECGIQAADLVARECMKRLDNQIGPTYRPLRQSMKTLLDTHRFMFVYFQKPAFEMMVERVKALGGPSLNEYRVWLDGLKLQDNQSNRIRYLEAVQPITAYPAKIEK